MKTIQVSKKVWVQLRQVKDKFGFKTFNEVIKRMIEQIQESV